MRGGGSLVHDRHPELTDRLCSGNAALQGRIIHKVDYTPPTLLYPYTCSMPLSCIIRITMFISIRKIMYALVVSNPGMVYMCHINQNEGSPPKQYCYLSSLSKAIASIWPRSRLIETAAVRGAWP